jgi:hypothetical protein
MQQLMTLEIDLMMGQTDDNIGLLRPIPGAEDDGSGSEGEEKESNPKSGAQLNFGGGQNEMEEPASNQAKLSALEEQLGAFTKIFGNGNEELGSNPNETIQDQQRLQLMEKQERFGLKLFKRDHL